MHLIPRTCLHFVDYRNCHRKLTVSNINFKVDKSCLGWILNWKKLNKTYFITKNEYEKAKKWLKFPITRRFFTLIITTFFRFYQIQW